MYSYEDRVRAVELFIKLGKRVRATIRQLGYPSKNALKGWHREYEQRLDLPVGYAGRGPKYSQAQKEAAIEHYLTHDRCIAATMRALGYPGRGTLTAWVREALPEARKTIVGRAGRPSYPEALKQAGVIGLCSRQESAQAVAEKLGVCRPTLYNWKNQLLGPEVPASMKRNNNPPPAPELAELERQLESLQRDIRHLQLERDLLKKANEIVKKDLGVDLQLLTNREKTFLVDALKELYALPELLAQLDLARSAYFYHRARVKVADKYLALRQTVTDIFELNHRCYGVCLRRRPPGRASLAALSSTLRRRLRWWDGWRGGDHHGPGTPAALEHGGQAATCSRDRGSWRFGSWGRSSTWDLREPSVHLAAASASRNTRGRARCSNVHAGADDQRRHDVAFRISQSSGAPSTPSTCVSRRGGNGGDGD
jgi:transposase-like protein